MSVGPVCIVIVILSVQLFTIKEGAPKSVEMLMWEDGEFWQNGDVTGRFSFLVDSIEFSLFHLTFDDILVLILSVNIIFDGVVIDCRQLRERCGVEDGVCLREAVWPGLSRLFVCKEWQKQHSLFCLYGDARVEAFSSKVNGGCPWINHDTF